MGLLKKLFGSKKNSEVFTDEQIASAGACPNCWGSQEYDGRYLEFVSDQTKANVSNDKANQKAFIQQFVETNITGIKLKKDGKERACPMCETKYKD